MTIEKPAIPASTLTKSPTLPQARFALGQIVATPGALQLLDDHNANLFALLARHACLDSEVCAEDAKANEDALLYGGRVLSVFTLAPGAKDSRLYLITDSCRTLTTALRPFEY